MKLPVNTKPWIQGAVVGAVATMIVGFVWGGWVTGSTYTKEVAAASRAGSIATMGSICAANFKAQPGAAAQVEALIKTSTWDRGNTIEKSGFAQMPGSTKVDSDVARACAKELTEPKT